MSTRVSNCQARGCDTHHTFYVILTHVNWCFRMPQEPSDTTTLPESKQQVTNFIVIQQTSIPDFSQLLECGAMEFCTSWSCSLCVPFCEYSPFMVSVTSICFLTLMCRHSPCS